MRNSVRTFWTILWSVCLVAPAVHAQTDLTENQKAVIAFDFRVNKILENSLMQNQQAKDAFVDAPMELPGGISLEQVKRVFGAVSLPDNVAQLAAMQQPGSLPMELFVRIQFADASAADEMIKELEDDSETLTKDGVSYIRPPGNEPENLLAHRFDLTTVEFGTNNYLFREDRKVFSNGLQQAWNKVPDHAFRMAMDLDGRRDFIDQAVAMAKQQAPPMMGGFIDLINKASDLRISMDLDGDHLLLFSAAGVDESNAEELRKGLDGVMGLAKMSAQQMMPMIAGQDPESAKVVGKLVESLAATRDGLEVHIGVPKPAGFDEAVLRLAEQAKKSAAQTNEMNRVRQYVLSVHNYHDANRKFPVADEDDKLSWRVRVLPFMEENELYDEFNLDEAWDSETNKPLASRMPEIYGADGSTTDACWIKVENPPESFRDVRDGTSNTILILQNPEGVPWTQPKDLTIEEAIEIVQGLEDGRKLIAGFYDGSVRVIDKSIDEQTLRNLLDPNDGNVVDDF